MVAFLPLVVLFFATACDKTGYPSQRVLSMTKEDFIAMLSIDTLRSLFDPLAMAGYLAFIGWLVVFTISLKGDKYPGVKLRDGKYLKYECNGMYLIYWNYICNIRRSSVLTHLQ